MSDHNLSYHQRIVCVALRRMTKDSATIRNGFLHWSNTLSNKNFNVNLIVDELVEYLGLNGNEKKSLMLTMLAASNKLHDELPPVPQVLLDSITQHKEIVDDLSLNKEGANTVGAAKSPQWEVIHHYLKHMVIYLGKFSKEGLVEFSTEIKEHGIDGLNESVNQALRLWGQNGFEHIALDKDIQSDECSEIAHSVYLLIIEIIGPVNSDLIVNRVIDECLKLPAAEHFDPRNLL